jgi:hypothetical protein
MPPHIEFSKNPGTAEAEGFVTPPTKKKRRKNPLTYHACVSARSRTFFIRIAAVPASPDGPSHGRRTARPRRPAAWGCSSRHMNPFALERTACANYCAVGMVGFGFCTGQSSHTNELAVASMISSRLVLRRLKDIGREQVAHLGHGLYIASPCSYCRRTQRAVGGDCTGIRLPSGPKPSQLSHKRSTTNHWRLFGRIRFKGGSVAAVNQGFSSLGVHLQIQES